MKKIQKDTDAENEIIYNTEVLNSNLIIMTPIF